MAKKEQQVTYLVLARWSEIDQHYQFMGAFDTQEAADEEAEHVRENGALATRVECRTLPKKKGGKDVESND